MAGNNSEATFTINLESNSGKVAASAAAEVEELRKKILGGNDAVKNMGQALRSLRGSTDDVKSAKEQLKAKINAERDAISAANIALLKHGTTYNKVATESRALGKAGEAADNMGNALKASGLPVDALAGGFEKLKGIVGGAGGAMGALVFVAAAVAAAIVALVAEVIHLGVELVKFIVTGADAARSMNLMREASTGSAQEAHDLGTQVEALASKVPMSRDAINELGISLKKTRLSGQAIVDTMNLVGQASSAMGDTTGKALEDIVTRGQIMQRMQIMPRELQGTGLKFEDVAAELATSMHVGVKEAQVALFEGRVKLDDGAKALRAAVEKRFAQINTKKLLSIGTQVEKFKEKLGALTADVNLEPLLKGFAEIASLFDVSTVTGSTLKVLITDIGNSLGPAFQGAVPIIKGVLKGLVIGALDVAIAFLEVRKSLRETFGTKKDSEGIDWVAVSVTSAKIAVYGLVGGVVLLGGAFALATVPIWGTAAALFAVYEAGKWVWDHLKAIDWSGIGTAMVEGIVGGLKSMAGELEKTVTGLADSAKKAFTDVLGIHSPSSVFAGYGENTAQGFAEGMAGGAGGAQNAATTLAPAAPGGGGGGRGGPITVHVNINADGKGGSVAKELSSASFLASLTDAIEDALQCAGVPIQSAVAP